MLLVEKGRIGFTKSQSGSSGCQTASELSLFWVSCYHWEGSTISLAWPWMFLQKGWGDLSSGLHRAPQRTRARKWASLMGCKAGLWLVVVGWRNQWTLSIAGEYTVGVNEPWRLLPGELVFPKAVAGLGGQSGYDWLVTCPTKRSSLPDQLMLWEPEADHCFILDKVSCSWGWPGAPNSWSGWTSDSSASTIQVLGLQVFLCSAVDQTQGFMHAC